MFIRKILLSGIIGKIGQKWQSMLSQLVFEKVVEKKATYQIVDVMERWWWWKWIDERWWCNCTVE